MPQEGDFLALPIVYSLIISTWNYILILDHSLEQRDVKAVESSYPGFSYDLVTHLVQKADLSSVVNMTESLLHLQGTFRKRNAWNTDPHGRKNPFKNLTKVHVPQRILSRIPAEITDRKTFLETIKEIASAIKKLLDAVNDVSAYIPGTQGKQALDQRKREFVKYSKRFSLTLKEYFKEG
ncbi:Uncharacterized protein FKW44_006817, partial [Caligus rogercresseyi]